MKRRALVVVLAVTILTGCPSIFTDGGGGAGEGDDGETGDGQTEEMGTVRVTIERPVSTSAWSNSDVSAMATVYEILLYNWHGHITSGRVSPDGAHTLSVPADRYTIVVFAGVPAAGGSRTNLLGLGGDSSVSVRSGTTTEVSVGVNTYDWTTAWPEGPLETGATYELVAEVIFPISLLSFDRVAYDRVRFYADHFDVEWIKTGPNRWKASAEIVAPASPGTYECWFLPLLYYQISLRDPGCPLSEDLDDLTEGMWGLPGRYTFDDHQDSPMWNELSHEIEVIPPTELDVDIGWSPDWP